MVWYGNNAVIHVLSAKAYSRALRGHLIIDQALSKLIIEKPNDDSFISEFEPLYNDATQGKKETSEIEGNKETSEIVGNKETSEIEGNRETSEIEGKKETSVIEGNNILHENLPEYRRQKRN